MFDPKSVPERLPTPGPPLFSVPERLPTPGPPISVPPRLPTPGPPAVSVPKRLPTPAPPSAPSIEPPCGPMRNLSSYDPSLSDSFIRFIASMLSHSFVLADSFEESALGTMRTLEHIISEHVARPGSSRLSRLVGTIGTMHTPLALGEAFITYDAKYHVTQRKHVPPTEDEVRHILNLAQVYTSAADLQFISFDGDETLYADGRNFASSDASKLARYIEKLLENGVAVALVTAAGYRGAPEKYEIRLDGLLSHFAQEHVPDDALGRFFVVGGECNYLFECHRVSAETAEADGRCAVRLKESAAGWCEAHASWPEADVARALDIAEASLRQTADDLALRCRVIRKDRAVGIIPGGAEAKVRRRRARARRPRPTPPSPAPPA